MSQSTQIIYETCRVASSGDWWVPIISGLSAVLGAAVVAWANFLTTKRTTEASEAIEVKKLRVSLVTSERLRWLQDLRNRMSNLFVDLDTQRDLIRRPASEPMRIQSQKELDEISRRVMAELNNITLMLNPGKPDQARLKNALQEILGLVMQGQGAEMHAFTSERYRAIKTSAFDALTAIGVVAWSKIQELE
jgi:hypothetical protein